MLKMHDRGVNGLENCLNLHDIICGWPLMTSIVKKLLIDKPIYFQGLSTVNGYIEHYFEVLCIILTTEKVMAH